MNAKWYEHFVVGDVVEVGGFNFKVTAVKKNGRLNLKLVGDGI